MAISAAKLEEAMVGLGVAWRGSEGSGGWEDVRVLERYGAKYLRITRTIKAEPEAINGERELDDEDDEEALPSRSRVDGSRLVHYDIVHSPSYQVPVLYLTFPGRGLPPPDEVYECLVPAAHKEQVQSVGLMGALSMAEHPVSGLPAYFVHPCRTQDAMMAVTGGKEVTPERYLLLWLGVIGSSVGLSLLVEVARRVMDGGGA